MWTTQRVDWKTYTGLAGVGVGATLVTVATAYFGRTARQKLDGANTNDQTVVEETNREVSRLQSQGWAVLWTGAGIGVAGLGLIVWDLSTVERVRRAPKSGDASVMLSGNGASVLVRF